MHPFINIYRAVLNGEILYNVTSGHGCKSHWKTIFVACKYGLFLGEAFVPTHAHQIGGTIFPRKEAWIKLKPELIENEISRPFIFVKYNSPKVQA